MRAKETKLFLASRNIPLKKEYHVRRETKKICIKKFIFYCPVQGKGQYLHIAKKGYKKGIITATIIARLVSLLCEEKIEEGILIAIMVIQLLRKKRRDTTRNHGFTIIAQIYYFLLVSLLCK